MMVIHVFIKIEVKASSFLSVRKVVFKKVITPTIGKWIKIELIMAILTILLSLFLSNTFTSILIVNFSCLLVA